MITRKNSQEYRSLTLPLINLIPGMEIPGRVSRDFSAHLKGKTALSHHTKQF
jgi:hypothetical protein